VSDSATVDLLTINSDIALFERENSVSTSSSSSVLSRPGSVCRLPIGAIKGTIAGSAFGSDEEVANEGTRVINFVSDITLANFFRE
jgi:hypothetical protein